MRKKISLILTALLLGACSTETSLLPSEPQQMQIQKIDKASQKSKSMLYQCKQGKQIRVVQITPKKSRKKNLRTLSITFNGMTEKLTRSISQQGKEYTNIRWRWIQREDQSILTNSLGVVLAEQCILQINK
ncbi:Opacity-associated protein OapB [Rodentibacter caecimuris]|uniref:Opacity-associated protein OapB n=1 Tax=Rodentibacter caecimuris TaxID=1796644 RepID=A0ABX3KYS6_9PAST|nr:Opacity-associated protein OapB [Rodentibacter heylii]